MRKTKRIFMAISSMLLLSSCSSGILNNLFGKVDDDPITFSETTIIDNDECAITITEIDPHYIDGQSIKVDIENKTTDKKFVVYTNNEYVNGLSVNTNFYEEIGAERSRSSRITFYRSELKKYGVTKISDIELEFYVGVSNSAETVVRETVHIYPYGEENVIRYERESSDTDNVIIDNEYAEVTVIGYKDYSWGFEVNMFLENKSEKELLFDVGDSKVNGITMKTTGLKYIVPGNLSYLTFGWSCFDLLKLGITDITQIEFEFEISYEVEAFVRDYIVMETFTLKP
ncbi:MAG: hypothetical protein J1F31_02435 [Erysipelotrichales bacterium]|nr:hypothetical protein [Erysipelotrichales bacterium]